MLGPLAQRYHLAGRSPAAGAERRSAAAATGGCRARCSKGDGTLLGRNGRRNQGGRDARRPGNRDAARPGNRTRGLSGRPLYRSPCRAPHLRLRRLPLRHASQDLATPLRTPERLPWLAVRDGQDVSGTARRRRRAVPASNTDARSGRRVRATDRPPGVRLAANTDVLRTLERPASAGLVDQQFPGHRPPLDQATWSRYLARRPKRRGEDDRP